MEREGEVAAAQHGGAIPRVDGEDFEGERRGFGAALVLREDELEVDRVAEIVLVDLYP